MRGWAYGLLVVDEPTGPRFDLALGLLKAGQAVIFGGVGVRVRDEVVKFMALTQWHERNLTASVAWEEIDRARAVAKRLAEVPAFRQITADRTLQFSVMAFEYEVCWLEGTSLRWRPALGGTA
jgi:hypothetical protein